MKLIAKVFFLLGSIGLCSSVAQAEGAKLLWLGHAAFQYTTAAGKVILFDPWTSNPKAPKGYAPKRVDAILVSHGHFDHVGEAFALAKKFKAPLVASFELTEIAKAKGVKNVQPLNASGSAEVAGVTVTAVNAIHSSSYQDGKRTHYAGAPLGFVVAEPDSPVLYHAGDTGVFGDMEQIGELYRPEIALLPVGGVFTMKPVEAARAARLLQSRVIIPMHWGTFPALVGNPGEVRSAMMKASAPGKMKELTPGVEVKIKELF